MESKNKKVLLFTSYFPYKVGDGNFLQNEIDDLAEAFDKVYIARENKLHDMEEFELPHNVELIFKGYRSRNEKVFKGFLNFLKLPLFLFPQDISKIKSIRFFFRFIYAFLFGRAVFSNHKIKNILDNENETDLVLYYFWGAGMAYSIPWFTKKNHIVIKLHRGDLYENFTGYIPFRKSIYERVNRIITISEDGKEYVSKFMYENNIFSDKVEVIKLGTRFYDKIQSLKQFEEKVVVSCSALEEVKRVHLIYKVLLQSSRNTKIRWIHFGDGGLKNELLKQINKSENLIVDFKGMVFNNKIMEFYKSTKVDLFINLSISEGIPVSIMEAISFDIPVLATNAGGTGEIVGEELGTGVLVPVDIDVKDTAKIVDKILEGNFLFNPQAYWDNNFNRSKNNKKLIKILKN